MDFPVLFIFELSRLGGWKQNPSEAVDDILDYHGCCPFCGTDSPETKTESVEEGWNGKHLFSSFSPRMYFNRSTLLLEKLKGDM